MSISVANVRTAIAAQVSGLSGFKQMRIPPEYMGRTQNTIAHKGFVVSVETSRDAGERQRRAIGTYLETTARVSFAYRLRPKSSYPTDYDSCLDAEEAVIIACLGSYSSYDYAQGLSIRYNQSTRRVVNSTEWMICDIVFTVLHTIPST